MKTWIVTGGAGFIGSNFILEAVKKFASDLRIINLDKLTYAGNLLNLKKLENYPNHIFVRGDIGDNSLVSNLFYEYQPEVLLNFAAETHVDRSIQSPEIFIQTNITGTFRLLETSFQYFKKLDSSRKEKFRFLHISTDEVFGTLSKKDPPFHEKTPYAPTSPYSASKAASDFLVRSYFHTYQLPILITNCSNNYGPYQFPEKLIPLIILNVLEGKPLPLYGDGSNIRDWIYVTDHCQGILRVLEKGNLGESYNIGGLAEKTNLQVVEIICEILDELKPAKKSYKEQITFVKDRPGHDKRYAMDLNKMQKYLDWKPQVSFEAGLRKTICWYLENKDWVQSVKSGEYSQWIDKNYSHRALP